MRKEYYVYVRESCIATLRRQHSALHNYKFYNIEIESEKCRHLFRVAAHTILSLRLRGMVGGQIFAPRARDRETRVCAPAFSRPDELSVAMHAARTMDSGQYIASVYGGGRERERERASTSSAERRLGRARDDGGASSLG